MAQRRSEGMPNVAFTERRHTPALLQDSTHYIRTTAGHAASADESQAASLRRDNLIFRLLVQLPTPLTANFALPGFDKGVATPEKPHNLAPPDPLLRQPPDGFDLLRACHRPVDRIVALQNAQDGHRRNARGFGQRGGAYAFFGRQAQRCLHLLRRERERTACALSLPDIRGA